MATNLELAGKVAKNVELDAVNLKYARVESKCEPSEVPDEVDIDLQYRTSFRRRLRKDESSVAELAVVVEFKFNVKSKDGESPADVISLEAGYLLVYILKDDSILEDECFKHFSEVNGPYNAWPYWRELVQSVTGRVGLPGFVVPVFRPAVLQVDSSVIAVNADE
ncbi:hypothetical protein [Xanthomonas sacchari]|uniref:hypothetical protein n=1 Tax=Xanthomonas sacchari TaxID=56458 RepID=UPI0022560ECA|nr:hypothetical protein [Xanthomonas sacchari]